MPSAVATGIAVDEVERTDLKRDLRHWCGAVAAALALHLLVALVLLVDFRAEPAPPDESLQAAMTVEVAIVPSAPTSRPSEAPPGPEQVEQRVQRQRQPDPVRFDPPPPVSTATQALALSKRETPPQPPQDTAQVAVERTTAAPSTLNETADAAQAPIEGAPNEHGTDAVMTWHDKLLAHLERHKRYPRAAQLRRQEDVIHLRFRIDRSGTVLDWSIARSHGYALLDAEVNALMRRASPLPPPPQDIGGDPIEMVMPVEFFLDRRVASGAQR